MLRQWKVLQTSDDMRVRHLNDMLDNFFPLRLQRPFRVVCDCWIYLAKLRFVLLLDLKINDGETLENHL